MKAFHVLMMVFVLFLLTDCKQDSAQVQTETPAASANQEQQPAAEQGSGAVSQAQPSANTTPANLSQGHDYTYLTDKILLYKAAVGGQNNKSPYKDEWIDLEPDGTFKAGKLKNQTHTGKWGYNHDVKVLQLIPDDSNFPRSEWKVMHNEQMMVWVGTQTYGNNNTQIQLVKSNTLPE